MVNDGLWFFRENEALFLTFISEAIIVWLYKFIPMFMYENERMENVEPLIWKPFPKAFD